MIKMKYFYALNYDNKIFLKCTKVIVLCSDNINEANATYLYNVLHSLHFFTFLIKYSKKKQYVYILSLTENKLYKHYILLQK